ncbi:MAG: 23S rRNA (adenine(2503)-C(2))-methyltransferase RlmN [Vicinamibacteria bacterium]|nr:23S rRNA (adenine(2503)-C(2))-methyltransferase RlmN [Vicinamibacteria bacterium]
MAAFDPPAPPSPLPVMDALALTVGELRLVVGSDSRALALKRILMAGPLGALPSKVAGVSESVLAPLRPSLALPRVRVTSTRCADDGATKWAMEFGDGQRSETVLIPSRTRATVCVSSQSGCTRACAFCATATIGFRRNLSAGEIVHQYLVARAAAQRAGLEATNVVFMGMGEPLDNIDAVLRAVRSLTDVFPGLSPRRVTVSTSGVVPPLQRFLKESRASLALSLNATTDEVRTRIMPHNKTWPLGSIMKVLREATAERPRRFFVEYVQLPGVNDTSEDAGRIADLLRGLDCHVNVIPHNPFPGSRFRAPDRDETLRFHRQIQESGLTGIIRWPRGRDVAGACGQLALRTA